MVVTDRVLCGGAEGLAAAVEAAVSGGADAVQLREKDPDGRSLPASELAPLAHRLRAVTQGRALLVVNDRVDIALAVDENFDQHILRALLRRLPSIDARTVQSAGLSGADDTAVLEWAASEGRVVLTHDVQTMTRFAYDRANRPTTQARTCAPDRRSRGKVERSRGSTS